MFQRTTLLISYDARHVEHITELKMTRFILPLLAMAFAQSATAQSQSDDNFWEGNYFGVTVGTQLDSDINQPGVPGSDAEIDGVFGAGQFGFWAAQNRLLYGGEISFSVSEPAIEQPGAADVDVRITSTRIAGQLGYDLGRFMPHASLGIGRLTFQDTVAFGDTSSFGVYGGLGVEYRVSDFTTVGFEIIRESFDDFDEGASLDYDQTTIGLQLNFRY